VTFIFVVNIAFANMDYMWAGPGSLAQYLIDPRETGFTIRLSPFSWNATSPMDISREASESVQFETASKFADGNAG
jgi:hypothetical protein